MTKTNYDAICKDIQAYGTLTPVMRTISDADGTQEVRDYIDVASLAGRIRTSYSYEGGARDWRCVGVEESLLFGGIEYLRSECEDEEES